MRIHNHSGNPRSSTAPDGNAVVVGPEVGDRAAMGAGVSPGAAGLVDAGAGGAVADGTINGNSGVEPEDPMVRAPTGVGVAVGPADPAIRVACDAVNVEAGLVSAGSGVGVASSVSAGVGSGVGAGASVSAGVGSGVGVASSGSTGVGWGVGVASSGSAGVGSGVGVGVTVGVACGVMPPPPPPPPPPMGR